MLSKKDIYKELGRNINITPFNENNIKENSVNITVSEYAWATATATVVWCGGDEFHIEDKVSAGKSRKKYTINKGKKSIFRIKLPNGEKDYLILLPRSTTIVESLEVIGLGSNIGGAVHSKVGVVARGIGDMGTMLGPGYCGHLMLSLHNVTDDVIALGLKETVVSLTFDYLKTPVERTSTTSSSHYDKLLELGIRLDKEDKDYFSLDWKGNLPDIQMRLTSSKEYKEFKEKQKKYNKAEIRKWFTPKRILQIISVCAMIAFLGYIAQKVDAKMTNPVWVERYWTILIASIVAYFIPKTFEKMFES